MVMLDTQAVLVAYIYDVSQGLNPKEYTDLQGATLAGYAAAVAALAAKEGSRNLRLVANVLLK